LDIASSCDTCWLQGGSLDRSASPVGHDQAAL